MWSGPVALGLWVRGDSRRAWPGAALPAHPRPDPHLAGGSQCPFQGPQPALLHPAGSSSRGRPPSQQGASSVCLSTTPVPAARGQQGGPGPSSAGHNPPLLPHAALHPWAPLSPYPATGMTPRPQGPGPPPCTSCHPAPGRWPVPAGACAAPPLGSSVGRSSLGKPGLPPHPKGLLRVSPLHRPRTLSRYPESAADGQNPLPPRVCLGKPWKNRTEPWVGDREALRFTPPDWGTPPPGQM